jgi:hypothetical protein
MSKANEILDIELEKLSLGELSDERTRAVEKALERPETVKRLEALRASDEAILEEYPPRVMALQIEARLRALKSETKTSSRIRILVPSLTAAAAAVLLVLIFAPGGVVRQNTEAPPTERIKTFKTPALFVFRKGDESSLMRGQGAREGDVVQLKYNAKGATHGVIFSIDGRGTVTLHFPSNSSGNTALQKEGTAALGYSYELDDAPKFERFFFVTSDKPLNVGEVLEKAEKLGPQERARLPLEAGLNQCDFVLKKVTSSI